jgi:hypothetical protein
VTPDGPLRDRSRLTSSDWWIRRVLGAVVLVAHLSRLVLS